MEFSKLHHALRQACEYPVEQSDIVERFGDFEMESPTGETVRIETLLQRTDESVDRSAHGVETSVAATLPGSFVGRRSYDDRSHNPMRSTKLSF